MNEVKEQIPINEICGTRCQIPATSSSTFDAKATMAAGGKGSWLPSPMSWMSLALPHKEEQQTYFAQLEEQDAI